MKIIAGIALIVFIALLGSRKTFTRVKLPLAARHIYLTGTEYILVGLCLGDNLLGILDEVAIRGLTPLLYLALGWIGLMFGIQLDVKQIARFPRQYFLVSVVQAVVTFLVCSIPFLVYVYLSKTSSINVMLCGALALGAIAVPTAQSSLALIQRELHLRRSKLVEILNYVAGVDAILALIIFGVLFSYARTGSIPGDRMVVSASYFGVSIGLGALMGTFLHILTRLRCSQEELLLYVIGTVVLTAGAAAYLGLSPLFVTTVCGFVLANARGAKARILSALTALEKPLYIVVLLIGGAMLDPGRGWYLLLGLASVYLGLRTVGKIAGGVVSSLTMRTPVQLPRLVGLGLVSQGGMAAAMVVSFHRSIGGPVADSILFVVLGAIMVNELISPFLARIVAERES